MAWYEVISPEVKTYDGGGFEPSEYGRHYVLIEAKSKREALQLAVASPQMSGWVKEARSDGMNPFKGLKAYEAVCPHGLCWVYGNNCPECEELMKQLEEDCE